MYTVKHISPAIYVVNPLKRLLLKWLRRSNILSFERVWQEHSTFPRQLSLSLSLLCTSDCIYCAARGLNIAARVMPYDLVMKILDEAQAAGFKGPISLSENGEALVHPRFMDILRETRKRFPGNEIILFTNMVLLDEGKARAILGQGVDLIRFNLDGASEAAYEYVKRNGKYQVVRQNIETLFRVREELKSPCRIGVGFVTAKSFSEDIEGKSGVFADDALEILEFFKPLLRPGDEIGADPVTLEKYQFAIQRPKREPCDLFRRILDEMLVAPNGQVYVCCADYGVTSSLGNLTTQTIGGVWSGELRKTQLRHIYREKYSGAFKVCQTCMPSYHYTVNRDQYLKVLKQVRSLFRRGELSIVDGQVRVQREANDAR